MNTGDNRQCVENWFQLNQYAKKLEVYLKGKPPRPESDIQGLLSQAEIENSSRIICTNNSGKTSVPQSIQETLARQGTSMAEEIRSQHECL